MCSQEWKASTLSHVSVGVLEINITSRRSSTFDILHYLNLKYQEKNCLQKIYMNQSLFNLSDPPEQLYSMGSGIFQAAQSLTMISFKLVLQKSHISAQERTSEL